MRLSFAADPPPGQQSPSPPPRAQPTTRRPSEHECYDPWPQDSPPLYHTALSSRSPSLSEARSSPERHSPGSVPLQPPWSSHDASNLANPLENLDEAQIARIVAANATRMALIKDELTLTAGNITPGVDDTPFIHNALEALTREPRSSSSHQFPLVTPQGHLPRRQALGNQDFSPSGVAPECSTTQHPLTGTSTRVLFPPQSGQSTAPHEPLSPSASAGNIPRPSDLWIAVDKDALQAIDPRGRTYPPLTFKPRILRPLSMALMLTLCLVMMAALIFSNRFSEQNAGLTPYPGSIYSGQYFLFRILPQLAAAVILIYAQSILTASIRMLPFTLMAKEDPRERYLALFQSISKVASTPTISRALAVDGF